jgi:toxin ParE2
MNRKSLRIRSEAQEEINAAFEYYFQRSPESADAFLTEVATSLRLIVYQPRLYPSLTKNTRRRVLEGFPYSVIYREKDDIILVLAVAHAKRRPGYWRKRI